MRPFLSLQNRMEQRMRMAPQIIQSMEILQLSSLELQERLSRETLENPVLDVRDAGSQETPASAEKPGETPPEREGPEGVFDRLVDSIADYGRSYSPARANYGDRDSKLEAIQNTAEKPVTLQEFLSRQLAMMEIPENLRERAEFLVCNFDEYGYLKFSIEDIARSFRDGPQVLPPEAGDSFGLKDGGEESLDTGPEDTAEEPAPEASSGGGAPVPEPLSPEGLEMEAALKIVQGLDPAGVGARDLKECLLLQLRRGGQRCPLEERLVIEHLPDILNNRVPRIVRKTGLDLETVRNVIDTIVSLNPKPGILFGGELDPYVMPDVVVEMVDGKYEVRIEDASVPQLRINVAYRTMLEGKEGNKEVLEYIQKKIESARWLIQAVEMRRTTLLRIARKIVEKQNTFLEHGPGHLSPLRMQTVADETGVHVSTVSRAITDKYMQTPQGIFDLRYFFTGGTESDDGSVATNDTLKKKVQALVDAEDKANPISDDEIVEKLKAEGFNLARRTVTKYRQALNIPPSRQRKRF